MTRWRSVLLVAVALAGLMPQSARSAPAPCVRRPVVEVVFVVDTTGSMGSLLDGLRRSLWGVCDRILAAKPAPELRLGLVAYRDRGDDYVTKVCDLTDDLDAAYLNLHELTAAGGGDTPESVNQALHDAVHQIGWSKDAVKLIILVGDAAPHLDYADDVKYPVTCQEATERGIVISAIRCGQDTDCATHFERIARQGGGTFATIAHNGGVRTVPTPLDKRLAELNVVLCKSVLVHGSGAQRRSDEKKLDVARRLPPDAAADRAGCLGKLGRVARFDLLESDRTGKVRAEDLPADELPASMQKLDSAGRRAGLDRATQERAGLLREADELGARRAAYAGRERGGRAVGIDEHVVEMVRRAAGRRLKF